MFLQAKRDDPNVKARERMISDLDAAYAKYREIIRNLKEGLSFYNGLSVRLVELRDSAAAWSNTRRQDLECVETFLKPAFDINIPYSSFVQSLNALSLERQKQQQARPLPGTGGSVDNEEIPTQPSLSPPNSSPYSTPSSPPPSSPPSRGSKRDRTTPRGIIAATSGPSPPAIADLPPPDSNQWESLPISPLPRSAPGASASPDVTRPRAKGKHTSTSPVPVPGHIAALVPLSTSPALIPESPTLKSNKAKKAPERHVF
jgi:programmed cell death 6-interacting protein